jgi:hypothetical protein
LVQKDSRDIATKSSRQQEGAFFGASCATPVAAQMADHLLLLSNIMLRRTPTRAAHGF